MTKVTVKKPTNPGRVKAIGSKISGFLGGAKNPAIREFAGKALKVGEKEKTISGLKLGVAGMLMFSDIEIMEKLLWIDVIHMVLDFVENLPADLGIDAVSTKVDEAIASAKKYMDEKLGKTAKPFLYPKLVDELDPKDRKTQYKQLLWLLAYDPKGYKRWMRNRELIGTKKFLKELIDAEADEGDAISSFPDPESVPDEGPEWDEQDVIEWRNAQKRFLMIENRRPPETAKDVAKDIFLALLRGEDTPYVAKARKAVEDFTKMASDVADEQKKEADKIRKRNHIPLTPTTDLGWGFWVMAIAFGCIVVVSFTVWML
jgi:hypothetical protein